MTAGTEPVRTEDGRWLVIGGRRWRATDPEIPEAFRRELVDELQSARRAVGSASTYEHGRKSPTLATVGRLLDHAGFTLNAEPHVTFSEVVPARDGRSS